MCNRRRALYLIANCVLLTWSACPITRAHADDDILIADFETENYGDWKTTGEAFGAGPARGALPGQMPVSGYLGKGLVNSFLRGDGTIGTLTSPSFKVTRPYINFLIGGGGYKGRTCINLLVDNKAVRSATGPNTTQGGSEELDWHSWDVKELLNQMVVIQIVDNHTGGWGHINVDNIVQSDKSKMGGPAAREIVINKRYLHLPVKTGAPVRRIQFSLGSRVFREFDMEMADNPTFFAFADVERFKGQKVTVAVNRLPDGSKALDMIAQSDDVPNAEELYREKNRPQFHFTSRRGWLNDPNGLVFFDGAYHLFYQHNPYGWNWGNMHWGHAISKDLVHWQELSEALYPTKYGDWCFSGSAFVVKKGQAGFDRDTLVAAFTSTGRGECLVASTDGGRSWKEPPGNPVVKHVGRDPKVIWHEPTKRWIMAVYDEYEGKQWIAFHSSVDLRKWEFESRIEGFYECPDLFELPIAGETKTKWVLYAADGKYVLGSFDGKKFSVESGKHQLWYGNFYAAQTFSDVPDGRRIQIGWGQGIAFPGSAFNQQMTVPCELTLQKTQAGVRMFAEPVKELNSLRDGKHEWKGELKPGENPLSTIRGELFDVRVEFKPQKDVTAVGINVRGIPISFDRQKHELTVRSIRIPLVSDSVKLRILVDRGSAEVFVNEGQIAVSLGVIAADENKSIELFSRGGTTTTAIEVNEVKSAWR